MASEFSTNIREIAAELKGTEKAFAAGVRRAIRVTVAEAGKDTVEAIKAGAEGNGLHRAAAGTAMRVSFSVRSGTARITTSQRIARYARPLEKGSAGSGGGYNRHPVFGGPGSRRPNAPRVNQPTRPYFYKGAQSQERVSEAVLLEAVDAACVAAGFRL